MYQVVALFPASPFFEDNEAYKRVFQSVPRILVGGWLAVFAGDFSNNFVLAKLKVVTKGRFLWLRTISSTVVGQLANTAVFYVVALGGVIPSAALFEAVIAGWLIKTGVEILFTPVTYAVVGWLKRVENEDFYDDATDFNPFRLTVD